jgi:hypothetical protein
MKRRDAEKRDAIGNPDEVTEFVEWQEHQYLGPAYYNLGKMPPMSAMRAMSVAAWWCCVAGVVLVILATTYGAMTSRGTELAPLLWAVIAIVAAIAVGVRVTSWLFGMWHERDRHGSHG